MQRFKNMHKKSIHEYRGVLRGVACKAGSKRTLEQRRHIALKTKEGIRSSKERRLQNVCHA